MELGSEVFNDLIESMMSSTDGISLDFMIGEGAFLGRPELEEKLTLVYSKEKKDPRRTLLAQETTMSDIRQI